MSERPEPRRSLDAPRSQRHRRMRRLGTGLVAASVGFAIGLVWPAEVPTPRGAAVDGPEVPEIPVQPIPQLDERDHDPYVPEEKPLSPRIRAREALTAESLAQRDPAVEETRPSLVPRRQATPAPAPRPTRIAMQPPALLLDGPFGPDAFPYSSRSWSAPPQPDRRVSGAREVDRSPAPESAPAPAPTPPTEPRSRPPERMPSLAPELRRSGTPAPGSFPIAAVPTDRPERRHRKPPLLPPRPRPLLRSEKAAPPVLVTPGPPSGVEDAIQTAVETPVGAPAFPAPQQAVPIPEARPPLALADLGPGRVSLEGGPPTFAFQTLAVPEPSTFLLVGLGLLALARAGRLRP